MTERLEKLQKGFLKRSAGEQRVLWLLLMAVIYMLWDQLLYSPLASDIDREESQIAAYQQEMQSGEQYLGATPVVSEQQSALTARLRQLLNTSTQLEEEITGLTTDLISPPRMTQVLQQVLQQETGLELVKLTNLPAVKLTSSEQGEQQELYRHSVELTLEGDFFDTVAYLQALEALPWTMGWSELSYQVLEYPRARIRLRINTLSTESDWIGA